ncbi:MAG: DUF6134 family protein [Chitinophagaceae bacterium]
MLLALTLLMIREYRIAGNLKEFLKRISQRLRLHIVRKAGILILVFLFSLTLKAQELKLNYQVIRNGDVIGKMYFQQLIQGCSTHLRVQSEVKARFILLLTIWAKEETIYRNGILIFSSIFRKLNGKEKTNRETKLEGNSYLVTKEGSAVLFNSYPIRFNLLSLYCTEPRLVSKAYADNFSEFVPVVKTGTHEYKVTLPDGSYNYYFYQDSICTRVEVHHSLYSLQFILVR